MKSIDISTNISIKRKLMTERKDEKKKQNVKNVNVNASAECGHTHALPVTLSVNLMRPYTVYKTSTSIIHRLLFLCCALLFFRSTLSLSQFTLFIFIFKRLIKCSNKWMEVCKCSCKVQRAHKNYANKTKVNKNI